MLLINGVSVATQVIRVTLMIVLLGSSSVYSQQAKSVPFMQAEEMHVSSAQKDLAGKPRFEVATIKPTPPGTQATNLSVQGGHRLHIVNNSVLTLLLFTENIQKNQIFNAPQWISETRYDIDAVPDGIEQPTLEEWKVMLRGLLQERFNLQLHREDRDLPVYYLRPSKKGTLLKRVSAEDVPSDITQHGAGVLVSTNALLENFVKTLECCIVDRPVINETGLTGKYDFTLSWRPAPLQADSTERGDAGTEGEQRPDIFTALREQLGLRLVAGRARTGVVVVDTVSKPTNN